VPAVAIDSNTPALEAKGPAIENEIPTYRAISGLAVISLILGLFSALSFAEYTFLIAAVLAVVTGLIAERRIRRLPDMLTGRGLAQAGIAMGLIFGLASVTIDQVQSFIRQRQARSFANSYVENYIKKGGIPDAMFFRMPPEHRRNNTPQKAFDALQKQMQGRDQMMLQEQVRPIKTIKERLGSDPAESIEVAGIETHGQEGLNPFATVLIRLSGPGKGKYPAEDFALLAMKADVNGGKYDWWIDQMLYPYKPKSFTPKSKPIDDGHGHAH
jgi:hypothetical protein